MAKHNELGDWGETLATEYLVRKGYVVKERNWHLGNRDIDIIVLSEDLLTVVFVEVKTRRWDDVIDPTEAVTPQKIRSIGYCANAYIKEQNLDMEIRFDIITVVGSPDSKQEINHIEDAFNPCLI